MAQAWHGPTLTDDTRHLGSLALIAPLLQRLDVAAIIDRHLPPDPQLAFSHGQVLSLLLAARLCQPTALINVPAWAADTAADLLGDIPADALNDDRLGRALDAFFSQRHSILTSVAAHVARLHRHGCPVLCSVPWEDYQGLHDRQADQLNWQRASYLSLEQQRRRPSNSSLPQEYYNQAVVRHTLSDPYSGEAIPCRVLFVYSSADPAICRQTRERDILRLRQGLQAIAATVARGHPQTTPTSITRRISRLFGKRAAARCFSWEMRPLTVEEQALLPAPARGCRRPRYRFTYAFDEAAATAAAGYDGLAALLTTAPLQQSGDLLFTPFNADFRRVQVTLGSEG